MQGGQGMGCDSVTQLSCNMFPNRSGDFSQNCVKTLLISQQMCKCARPTNIAKMISLLCRRIMLQFPKHLWSCKGTKFKFQCDTLTHEHAGHFLTAIFCHKNHKRGILIRGDKLQCASLCQLILLLFHKLCKF